MTITAVQQVRDLPLQFRGVFTQVIEYEATWDPASVNSNSAQHETVAVIGAQMGDFVMASIDVDIQGLDLVAHVTSADVVTVGLHNPAAGAVDLGSCNLHIILLRPQHLVG